MDAIRHTTSLLAMPPAKWRLWIGALALFVQLLMPVQHVLARGDDGGSLAVLCTAEGNVVVNLAGPDGAPTPAGKSMAGTACPLCGFGGMPALPAPDGSGFTGAARSASRVEFEIPAACAAEAGGSAAYGSRAPPVSV